MSKLSNIILIVIFLLLSGCSSTPTPFVLGEAVDAPVGYTLCKQERPDECD